MVQSNRIWHEMIVRLKSAVERIPGPLGRLIPLVPYRLRLGRRYGLSRSDIEKYEKMGGDQREGFIFERVRRIVRHAVATNEFYRWFYAAHGFDPAELRTFDDIARIPVLRKEDLRSWELEKRSAPARGRFKINTGGTTGSPLDFYSTREVFANEWAHMHEIWARLGYRQVDLKLTFRGKNLGADAVRYNPVHNELVVSAYKPLDVIASELEKRLRQRQARFIHGYPSTVYEFASYCLDAAPPVLERLRGTLAGILLGSEYPAPKYREVIKKAFGVPIISWYGHSEMAVLAYEVDESLVYMPFHTYGYAEAVANGDGTYRLVGTSYHNRASHFIRYDTGDDIVPLGDTRVLQSFRMASGRTSEFIVDANGKQISLTALIFGRHHEAFGRARFVQVQQTIPGRATILVVPASGDVAESVDWYRFFDLGDVALEFDIRVLDNPVRTAAGKTPLLVRQPA